MYSDFKGPSSATEFLRVNFIFIKSDAPGWKERLEKWDTNIYTRGLISPWLYKENNKLGDWRNVFSVRIPPWAPQTYDFVVLTSLTLARKILLVVLRKRKAKDLSAPLRTCKWCNVETLWWRNLQEWTCKIVKNIKSARQQTCTSDGCQEGKQEGGGGWEFERLLAG
jgi:hypothetical protein